MSERKTITQKIVCRGGLDSNQNHIDLSDNKPGAATTLLNFEPSLFGGYRRINGFQPLEVDYPEVDPDNAEGRIYGIAIFNSTVIVARKQQATDTYDFYYWTDGADWTKFSTGLTLSTTGLTRIRSATFNFDGTDKIIFVDGINSPVVFDGTNWVQLSSSGTGGSGSPGGDQLLDAPKYVAVFRNHIFISGDSTYPHLVAHSAPTDELTWTSASGGGQLIAGFNVVQLYPFRDENFIFGETNIKKIVVDATANFVLQDVAKNVGCIAPDSVVEINGDIIYLAQDSIRTVAGTERIGDVELGSISKNIQQNLLALVSSTIPQEITSVLVRDKSQVRFFFSAPSVPRSNVRGILGGLRGTLDGGVVWEWGELRGINPSCTISGYINNREFIVHGDYQGRVYRQEEGTSFDGDSILAVYTTPYLDFGDTQIRKTMRTLSLFARPEGELMVSVALQYDWSSEDVVNPKNYFFDPDLDSATYGVAVYGVDRYAGATIPINFTNIQGSGFSLRATFTSNDTRPCYSIQALVYELTPNDRK